MLPVANAPRTNQHADRCRQNRGDGGPTGAVGATGAVVQQEQWPNRSSCGTGSTSGSLCAHACLLCACLPCGTCSQSQQHTATSTSPPARCVTCSGLLPVHFYHVQRQKKKEVQAQHRPEPLFQTTDKNPGQVQTPAPDRHLDHCAGPRSLTRLPPRPLCRPEPPHQIAT